MGAETSLRAGSRTEGPIRILSIDGGGIRGVIPARLLVELERMTGRPIADLFDIVCGTSTGALIALGLVTPDSAGRPAYTAEEMLSIYLDDGPAFFPEMKVARMFDRTFWKVSRRHVYQRLGAVAWPQRFGNARYLATELEAVLERTLGETRLADALVDVVVPTYDWKAGRALIFTSSAAREHVGLNPRMRDVARGTTAAPTYFPPLEMTLDDGREVILIDGGVAANNPVSAAYYESLKQEAASERDRDAMVISLGTGRPPEEVPTYEELWSRGWLRLGMGLLSIVADGTSEIADELMRSIIARKEPHSRFWRFQVVLRGCSLALNDASEANLNGLLALADRMITDRRGDLEEVAHVLTAAQPVTTRAAQPR